MKRPLIFMFVIYLASLFVASCSDKSVAEKAKQLEEQNINWMILATGVYLTQIIRNNDAYEA